MKRESIFSYHCSGCGCCCSNKRIAVNPYDVLRLAENRGISTGEFIHHYVEKEGPYLRITEDGDCVFHTARRCDVHLDRPLPCRTYPLGRWVSPEGEEIFRELKPHPRCEGIYSKDGTVTEFLKQQDVLPYLEAANQYLALFDRLFDTLQVEIPKHTGLAAATNRAMFSNDEEDMPAFMEWLDAQKAVEHYCRKQRQVVPVEVEKVMELHIRAIDQWFNSEGGVKP